MVFISGFFSDSSYSYFVTFQLFFVSVSLFNCSWNLTMKKFCSQKFKLRRKSKTNTLGLLLSIGSNSILISEAQLVRYLTEMGYIDREKV
jgi:hypothetical protein